MILYRLPPITFALLTLAISVYNVDGQECPAGWSVRRGDPNCYYISKKSQATTWNNAKQRCAKGGGSLLKVESKGLQTWITGVLKRRNTADKSSHWWVGLSKDGTAWKWTDGSTNVLKLWRPGEPNTLKKGEDCAEFKYDAKIMGLNDESCTVKYPYVCQSAIKIPLYCDTETVKGWDNFNGQCYKYMNYRLSFSDARASCENAGGQLVSPGDQQTEQYVQNYAVHNKKDIWINVISQPIKTAPNYQIVWTNGSAISQAYWAPKQPSVPKGQENNTCVRVQRYGTKMSRWRTDSCDNEHQYVCHKDPGGCAPGWTPFSKLCYQFNYLSLLSWSDANKYCQRQGAILMEITSKDQQNTFLNPFMESLQEGGINSIWIGMSDSPNKAGAFKWTSGSKVSFKNWASGFPNDTKNKLDCGVIYTDDSGGKWTTTSNCLMLKGFLCQAKENDVIYPVSTPKPAYTCNPGWSLKGSTCYKVFAQRSTWTDAQSACSQNGGRLGRVLDAGTQSFLNKIVKQTVWFGLNDRSSNQQYMFESDTPVNSFKNWNKKEPNNRGDFNCGIMLATKSTRGKWAMVPCTKTYPYLCEAQAANIPPTVLPSTSPVTWSPNCGAFWEENPTTGYCYYFVNEPLSWNDAQDYCRNGDNQGELASITTLDEQNYITGRLTGSSYLSYWLGGNDKNTEGGWEWSDGLGFAFMNWDKGQPDNWKNKQDCLRLVMTSQFQWDDSSCYIRFPFICKKPGKNARPIPTQSTYVEPVCGEGWKLKGSTCYEFNAKRAKWGDARKSCLLEGGDLAIINNFDTQSFITNNLKIESWIGLNDRLHENGFVWNNNTKVTKLPYKNWAPGQPDDSKKKQDCVSVQVATKVRGKWRDNSCNGKWGYICQKPASCGDNWYLYGSSCYFFNTSGASWAGARKQCTDLGADLVTIKSANIQNFITDKILRESWTGLNDQIKNKQYRWLGDSNKVIYFNWAPGQPDNKDYEDCGTIMKGSGKWRDRKCTEQYGFICEKSSAELLLSCPDNWFRYNGKCYYKGYNPSLGSWQDARTNCLQMSSDLVSIQSKSEQNFVFSISRGVHSPVWIGLNDIDNFAGHRMFSWSDNSFVSYTFWSKGEPNNYNVKENCVAMNFDGKGGWNDYPCETQKVRAYMCEKEMEPTVFTSPSPLKTGCKSGLGYFGTCYTFVTQKMTFGNAEKYCSSKLKGHLLTINSRYVQAFIVGELSAYQGNWWIGLANSDPQTYKWKSGQSVTYTYWDVSHTGNEKAGAVTISADKPVGLWKNQAKLSQTLPFICESTRSGGFTSPPPDKPTPNLNFPCPTLFKDYNGYCYRAYYSSSYSRLNWAQARARCQRLGGELASIHNKDEQDFILKSVIRTRSGIYWIGINDIDREKGFRWSDSSPVGYTNWMPNQPDDHKGHEDCGEIDVGAKAWNDDNCNIAKNYICKVMKGAVPDNSVAIPTSGPVIPCSGVHRTWYFYKGNCYKFTTYRRSFYDARTYCIAMGGDLLSVHDHDESDFVISKISKKTTDSYWIGLNDLGESGYNWTDGSPVDFVNWYRNEPNDLYGQQSCVQIIPDGFWQDNNCGFLKSFICKATNGTTRGTLPPPTTVPPGNCPPGFFGMDFRCYIIKGDQKSDRVNWTTAVSRCKQMGNGINLATISNTVEQAYVSSHLFNRSYNVWLGLNDQQSSNRFVWLDNSKVTYTKWAKGEPNGRRPYQYFYRPVTSKPAQEEDCVEMYSRGNYAGYWNDKPCSALRGYVCQAQRSTSNPTPVTSPLPSFCRNGYTVFRNMCYKLDLTLRTFDDAQQSCRSDGGNLISIADSIEQAFLKTLVYNKATVVWIGLQQTPETGLYDWVDGWPVTFTRWASREPSREGQTCVSYYDNRNYWRDMTCTMRHASVCKIQQGSPPPFTTRPPGYCSNPSWSRNGNTCYYVPRFISSQSTNLKSWPDATYICSKLGMNLVTIRNKAENAFVKSLLKTGSRLDAMYTWIGLSSSGEGAFQWEDQTLVDFVNWAKNEPSNNRTRNYEECIAFGPLSGTWYDMACTNRYRYVCSTPAIIPTPVVGINRTITKSTPLPIITQVSSATQTQRPVTQKTVTPKPVTQRAVTRPVTQRAVTNRPVTQQPFTQRPPQTFAPTRKPFTAFPPQGTTFRPQTKIPVVTRSPSYLRYQLNQSGKDTGISNGGIAGICIAIVLAVALVAVGFWYYRRRASSLRLQSTVGFDNALYNKTADSIDIGGND